MIHMSSFVAQIYMVQLGSCIQGYLLYIYNLPTSADHFDYNGHSAPVGAQKLRLYPRMVRFRGVYPVIQQYFLSNI